MNKTLCLINGISADKVRAGLEYAEAHLAEHAPRLSVYVQFMDNDLLDRRISRIIEEFWQAPVGLQAALDGSAGPLIPRRGRVIIIQSFIKEHVFAIMRGLKNVCSRPNDIIFAMVTETALEWTLDEYLVHLKDEHEHMKTHPPQNDPDMKKM
jgi:hypothetical protein